MPDLELSDRITQWLPRHGLEHVQRLYQELRDEIERGALPPGHIVTHPELERRVVALRHGAWPVVTCTLRLLATDGLVETRPHLGMRVAVEGETWTVAGRAEREPLGVFVERIVRNRLAEGTYPPHTRIPSRQVLADEFGVSDRTIGTGLQPLVTAGLLVVSDCRKAGIRVSGLVRTTPRADLLRLSGGSTRLCPRSTKYPLGEASRTLAEWSRDARCVVSYSVLKARVRGLGWDLTRAMTTPVRGVPPEQTP
ncbi:GntR family transcriptional regulator [Streptomyces sp. NPDC006655]|uniref:GntR family transcriptional regulator n=1 Tax=Streptomyces sp. NPDC006655 TaxID=3156898 RepID=UPI0034552B72